MPAYALEVIQRTCAAVGISSPTAAVGSSDDNALQMVELLNQECESLAARHDWTHLTFEVTFTSLAANYQGDIEDLVGSNIGIRKVCNDVMWDRTSKQPIYGPVSRSQWNARQAITTTGPYLEYRFGRSTSNDYQRGLYFYPAATAGHTIALEFVGERWCKDAVNTTFYENITADNNLLAFNLNLLRAGLEWRWLRKKGLSYAEEFASYEALVAAAIRNDGTKPRLRMDGPSEKFRAGIVVPVGDWSV